MVYALNYDDEADLESPEPQQVCRCVGDFVIDFYAADDLRDVSPRKAMQEIRSTLAQHARAGASTLTKIKTCVEKNKKKYKSLDVTMKADGDYIEVLVYGYRKETDTEVKRRLARNAAEVEAERESGKTALMRTLRCLARDYPGDFEAGVKQVLKDK